MKHIWATTEVTMLFENHQLETSADGETDWIDLFPDGSSLRYVRVKPSEWEKWQRQNIGLDPVAVDIATHIKI